MAGIETTERLRELIGTPNELVRLKIHRQLNAAAREFIARAPMLLLATCGKEGEPQLSPKGDAPGFVQIEDDRTLVIPERKGNKLAFSLENILNNPQVALIFLVPGTCETLRIEGRAQLDDDAALCQKFSARGSPALLVTRVEIEAVYFHCAKAFLRAELWKPETWPDTISVSFGKEIAQGGGLDNQQIDEFDAAVRSRYRTDL
ncbi:MAG: pyridoxamine 5'-phosphate oxidase family protein [Betaproteobacteria bacterium]|nr:MAG: pyridoxamine 5'-phosphate oxidase family protein [Betaproteobacteria bacterium]